MASQKIRIGEIDITLDERTVEATKCAALDFIGAGDIQDLRRMTQWADTAVDEDMWLWAERDGKDVRCSIMGIVMIYIATAAVGLEDPNECGSLPKPDRKYLSRVVAAVPVSVL